MGRLDRSLAAQAATVLCLISLVPTFVYWPSFFVIQGVVFLGIAIYWLVQARNQAELNPAGVFASGCCAQLAFICVTEPFVEQPSITNELFWLGFGTAASGSIALAYCAWRKPRTRS